MPPLPDVNAPSKPITLLANFLASHKELEGYRSGKPVVLDGQTLSIAAVTAASRYSASVQLDGSPRIKNRVQRGHNIIRKKVQEKSSIYGVSTGYGGSANTRTDQPMVLGNALLQLLHAGVLPSSTKVPDALPFSIPCIRPACPNPGGVRWELVEKMNDLLSANITPLVPLRGIFDGPAAFGARKIVSSVEALSAHNIEPIPLAYKEHLGILNGTAFSASVACLVLNDAVHLALLSQVCTAMGTEALAGSRGSFDPFIHDIARPHPGQIESAKIIWDLLDGSKFAITSEQEVTIEEDEGILRQDRYPLRTAPQFIGPQIEDLLTSLETITVECNSTTDNPLVDGETGKIHNGGNFQAMAVTNVMEKTRLGLHHLGKLLFSQCTELINPTMNRGLPPSLAATDPSLNYHVKGIDIATASYVAELGHKAAPVSTHIQSAEMHNQAVNSLALIAGRATIDSLDILSLLIASYLYVLCQALDLRALQNELIDGLNKIASEELALLFGLTSYGEVAASSSTVLVDAFVGSPSCSNPGAALASIPVFRSKVAARAESLLDGLRRAYLLGGRGASPASPYLNKTRPVYEFVRLTLGIKMHGAENYNSFANGMGVDADTTGANVSLIHEAIRDGKLQPIIVGLFA
ncbi:L-Aspartase-like protein [Mycena capillaripes]|nr:L-Aspartase-like protein [Mycena capillaripes]